MSETSVALWRGGAWFKLDRVFPKRSWLVNPRFDVAVLSCSTLITPVLVLAYLGLINGYGLDPLASGVILYAVFYSGARLTAYFSNL